MKITREQLKQIIKEELGDFEEEETEREWEGPDWTPHPALSGEQALTDGLQQIANEASIKAGQIWQSSSAADGLFEDILIAMSKYDS